MRGNIHLLGLVAAGAGLLGFAVPGGAESASPAAAADDGALKVLIVTGGCCHDYEFQSAAMVAGIGGLTKAAFTVVNEGGKGTDAQIALYDDPAWAKPFDVVIHNECFANTKDPDYIKKITDAHRAGVPAVVVHCAMHTYRSAEIPDWRDFLGVTSRQHEHQSRYPVTVTNPDHPVMKEFPKDWVTPMDELYVIESVGEKTTVLATSKSERNDREHPVVWVNDFDGTRVFGTTYGHTNDTFSDPVFIKLLTDGMRWAAGRDAAAE